MGLAVYVWMPLLAGAMGWTGGYISTKDKGEATAAAMCGIIIGGIFAWIVRHPRSWL